MRKLLVLAALLLLTTPPLRAADELKKYAGRYELEPGLIPIFTLDVTFADGTLWVKASLVKKRRLIPRSKTAFVDEVEQKKYSFNLNEKGEAQSLTFEYEGESFTAKKRELPAPSLKGSTAFKLKGYPDANVVALAGSFNNWDQSQILFAREGDVWICRIDLPPGEYAYKFSVDGDWILDPTNPKTAEDEAGNVNSVIVIKKE